MLLPLDVFDRRYARARLWEYVVLKVKDNKLALAAEAGERENRRRRAEKIGLPPLFL